MAEKKFRQSCECQNCGNEAEMLITCSLPSNMKEDDFTARIASGRKGSMKGHAVCSRCGAEADIWLEA